MAAATTTAAQGRAIANAISRTRRLTELARQHGWLDNRLIQITATAAEKDAYAPARRGAETKNPCRLRHVSMLEGAWSGNASKKRPKDSNNQCHLPGLGRIPENRLLPVCFPASAQVCNCHLPSLREERVGCTALFNLLASQVAQRLQHSCTGGCARFHRAEKTRGCTPFILPAVRLRGLHVYFNRLASAAALTIIAAPLTTSTRRRG